MEKLLASIFAFGLLLSVSLAVTRTALSSYQVLGESWQAARDLSEQRRWSDIRIESATHNGFDVEAVLENRGDTPISDFSAMDLVVHYSTGATNVIEWLPSVEGSLQPNSWTPVAVIDDGADPGVVNEDESLLMQICLDPPPGAGTVNWLQVTTDLGISAARSFTGVPSLGGCSACVGGDTGFQNPSSEAATTDGDGDGFEENPTAAFVDGGGFAANRAGPGDRHLYGDYGFAISSLCTITGIEVRLDWWVTLALATNSLSVELSWDGGASWTAAKSDVQTTTSEHAAVVGGPTDTWGRTWSPREFTDANFQVRLTSDCAGLACALQDFFLDWVPVRVSFAP